MSSSEEDVIVAWQFLRRRQRKKRKMRRYWIHPLNAFNIIHSPAIVLKEQLNLYPEKFKEYYRMNQASFRYLLEIVGPNIEKQNTNYRKAISSEERLLITLRERNMKINLEKTKIMVMGNEDNRVNIEINNQKLEQVTTYT
ncbi:uncharacterized protein LOC126885258 [Diabrotica virgifera virgifera]|uniref:Protein ANTAGONIST OF LIKE HETEROCHROMATIN PROTEIN 1-like n=1 Tax=Diabrotica virgifera virgifera TaxID=50390 RepID=A0ABM5KBY0_DIAVI|nr:uncharacterized protein LOC126885258 [Diabrotica virgifera virgifera]